MKLLSLEGKPICLICYHIAFSHDTHVFSCCSNPEHHLLELFHFLARRWEGGDPGVSNQKTPTTILLTPERKFHSFGYAARDFYHDLDPTESKHWLYFEKFKMKLHTTGVSNTKSVFATQVVFLLNFCQLVVKHLYICRVNWVNWTLKLALWFLLFLTAFIWQLYLASFLCRS